NRQPSTSVAAGDGTLAMVLLEAFACLAQRGGQVLAVVADEPTPVELRPSGQGMPWAGAFVLEGGARRGVAIAGRSPLALLQDLRALPTDVPGLAAVRPPGEVVQGLVEAIRAGGPAHVSLGSEVSCAWSMTICRTEGP
ncbi:MAG TPA: beta-ketoacyl synthase chain length factor, partial [Solirubrobacteraceae bacterium]|nr:beta-ketoacyl synthase chain length factor [Solirubrobacteraceae bacterium]